MELKIYNETLRAVYADCCGQGEGGYRRDCNCRCCVQYKAEMRLVLANVAL
jgi:hypothetical protein